MPVSSESAESELIRSSIAGDQNAFAVLVNRYQRLATSIVYRMTGQSQLAEDLAQEAFIRAWLNLSTFKGESSFRSWLGHIVTNLTIDHLRRNKTELALDEQLPVQTISPQARALQAELRDQVRSAVLAIPPQSRAALVLREFEGLSYREIAGVLDIPIGTVMSRLSYARAKLRELLEPELSAHLPHQSERCSGALAEVQ